MISSVGNMLRNWIQNMIRLGIFCSFLLLSIGARAEDNFDLSTPHWGAEIVMMPGGPLNGAMMTSVVFESTGFEAALGFNFYETRGTQSNEQQAFELRAAKRYEVGRLSYLNLGIDYAPTWGSSSGQSIAGNYTVGPYVGFSRQFPNSNVLFTVFVVPYEYQYTNSTTGPLIGSAYFLDGGIGIDYLF